MAAKTDFETLPNITFEAAVDQMTGLLEQLLACPARDRLGCDCGNTPGVYVFYEAGQAQYVGRTDRLKARILEHSRPGSTHTSASFAYNLAKCKARAENWPDPKLDSMSRKELCKDERFKSLYDKSKKQVAAMQVRFVHISDPHLQVLFEVYAALKLKARWTTFGNS